jgi:uncharacterized protein with HEPN domain
MPRERSEAASLFDMLRASEATLRHVAGKSRDDYEREELLRHAVERSIEIIGEAARRLTKEFRDRNPQIAWHAVMATRHILAHDYDEVDNDIVWRIVTDHIPVLIEKLRPLIPPRPPVEE